MKGMGRNGGRSFWEEHCRQRSRHPEEHRIARRMRSSPAEESRPIGEQAPWLEGGSVAAGRRSTCHHCLGRRVAREKRATAMLGRSRIIGEAERRHRRYLGEAPRCRHLRSRCCRRKMPSFRSRLTAHEWERIGVDYLGFVVGLNFMGHASRKPVFSFCFLNLFSHS